jgi:hypothetical protein
MGCGERESMGRRLLVMVMCLGNSRCVMGRDGNSRWFLLDLAYENNSHEYLRSSKIFLFTLDVSAVPGSPASVLVWCAHSAGKIFTIDQDPSLL